MSKGLSDHVMLIFTWCTCAKFNTCTHELSEAQCHVCMRIMIANLVECNNAAETCE